VGRRGLAGRGGWTFADRKKVKSLPAPGSWHGTCS
jgi:hypothetical protein